MQVLIDLGNMDDYYTQLDSMGFGNLTRMKPNLSSKLVKEFFAKVTLHSEDTLRPIADKGSISFFIHRMLHRMTLFSYVISLGFRIILAHICLRTGMLLSYGSSLDLEVMFHGRQSKLS